MFRFLRLRLRHNPITVTGRMLILASVCSLFAIVDPTLVGLLSYLLWILVPGFLMGLCYRPKLKVRAHVPAYVHAEKEFLLTLEFENNGYLNAYDLCFEFVGDSAGFALPAGPNTVSGIEQGKTVQFPIRLQANRRGVFELPAVQVASLFPLGLFRFLKIYPLATRVHVAPRLLQGLRISEDVQEFAEMVDGYGANPMHASFEYVGSREYQPGMNIRRWDFAAWARLGTPILRDYSEGEELRVAFVVDTFCAENDDPLFERILSYTAGVLSELVEERKVEVDLLLGPNQPVLSRVTMLDAMLALAAASGDFKVLHWQEFITSALQQSSSGTTVVMLLRHDSLDATLIAAESRNERNIVVRSISNTATRARY